MYRLLLSVILIFLTYSVFAQHEYIVLKKGNKSRKYFWKDSYISFQLKDKQWMKGILTKIEKDSFYLKIEIIRHSLMGSDTVHVSGFHFAISDIYAVPNKGIQIDYLNGQFNINRSAGHVHWYWVKSGWIFRAGAIGYTGLNVTNGLIKNDLTFSRSEIGVAAAVFLGGILLHHIYKPALRLGKKYHFESSMIFK